MRAASESGSLLLHEALGQDQKHLKETTPCLKIHPGLIAGCPPHSDEPVSTSGCWRHPSTFSFPDCEGTKPLQGGLSPSLTRYCPISKFMYVGNSAGRKKDHAASRAVCEILACLLVGTRLQPTLLSNLHPLIFFFLFYFNLLKTVMTSPSHTAQREETP